MIAEDELLSGRAKSNRSMGRLWYAGGCCSRRRGQCMGSLSDTPPNIVLTDLCARHGRVELVRKSENGRYAIIIITCIEDFDTLYQLMKMGITGCLIKQLWCRKTLMRY